jgi:hypothetical protein
LSRGVEAFRLDSLAHSVPIPSATGRNPRSPHRPILPSASVLIWGRLLSCIPAGLESTSADVADPDFGHLNWRGFSSTPVTAGGLDFVPLQTWLPTALVDTSATRSPRLSVLAQAAPPSGARPSSPVCFRLPPRGPAHDRAAADLSAAEPGKRIKTGVRRSGGSTKTLTTTLSEARP